MSGERPVAGDAEFRGYNANPDDTLSEIDAALAEAGEPNEERVSTQLDALRRPSPGQTLDTIDEVLADADKYTEENQ